jgi:hypothetical protein
VKLTRLANLHSSKVLAQKKQDQQTEGPHHDEADQGERAGLEAHYGVRFVLPNALLHLASWAEPNIDQDLATGVGGDGSMTTSTATP